MLLDLPTLFLVSTCITALLGVFLLVLRMQDRSVRALGYWAAAYLIGGFAVALWMVSPEWMPAGGGDLASALLFICCGLIWSGARKFHGRSAMTGAACAGAMVWLVAARMPELIDFANARVVISSPDMLSPRRAMLAPGGGHATHTETDHRGGGFVDGGDAHCRRSASQGYVCSAAR